MPGSGDDEPAVAPAEELVVEAAGGAAVRVVWVVDRQRLDDAGRRWTDADLVQVEASQEDLPPPPRGHEDDPGMVAGRAAGVDARNHLLRSVSREVAADQA